MIRFERNIKKILPYDRQQYRKFWNDDLSIKWYGVSLQLPGASEGKTFDLQEYIQGYEVFFKSIISKFDNGGFWIVNHDFGKQVWFPTDEFNLEKLRSLFKENKVPNNFEGAVLFGKDELLEYYNDLISYPSSVFNENGIYYKSIDISHFELPLIIKIYGRFSVDLLSTSKDLIRNALDENFTQQFLVKKFRGTSL